MELDRLRDPDEVMAIGRELSECLLSGVHVLLCQRGLSGEARMSAATMVPDGEQTDELVQLARAAFDQSPARGQKSFVSAREYDPFDPDVLNSEDTDPGPWRPVFILH